jgi:hypothetical protein
VTHWGLVDAVHVFPLAVGCDFPECEKDATDELYLQSAPHCWVFADYCKAHLAECREGYESNSWLGACSK